MIDVSAKRLYRWKSEEEFSQKPHRDGVQPGPASLAEEAEAMAPRLAELEAALLRHEISECDFCGAYILSYCQQRAVQGSVLLSKRKVPIELDEAIKGPAGGSDRCSVMPASQLPGLRWSERDARKLSQNPDITCGELFRSWTINGVKPYVATCMANWAVGRRPLKLFLYIPSVERVLALQAQGRRVVTAFVKPERLRQLIERRDAFDFLTHDLKHMENFVASPEEYSEQVGLLSSLHACLGDLRALTSHFDAETHRLVDYVLADMNADVRHMFCWLKACLINGHLRSRRVQPAPSIEIAPEEEEPRVEHDGKQWLTADETASFNVTFTELCQMLGLEGAAREVALAFFTGENACTAAGKGSKQGEALVAHFRRCGLRVLDPGLKPG